LSLRGSPSGSPLDPDRLRRRQRSRLLFLAVLASAVAGALVAPANQLAAPAPLARDAATIFPGGSYFNVVCGFSHRNNDDPIVHPGHAGRSHNHTYTGNRSVDASSTPESLRGGATTCDIGQDASGYWAPTLFAGREPVTPLTGIVYYVRRTAEDVRPFPADLKIIAGNATAKKPQKKTLVSWGCGGIGGGKRFSIVPACSEDNALELRVEFPNCWNGKSSDSPNHRSHMAYSSGGRCPASHPVAVPTMLFILLYQPVPRGARVASGKFAGHADFMNGWDPDALARFTAGLNY
jgi:hypothetical protein